MINFHPHVVHFPVALTFALFFYEAWCFFRKEEGSTHAKNFLLLFALLGALAAVGTGLWYEEFMPHPHEGAAHNIMERHETLGYVVLGVIVLLNILNIYFGQKKWGLLSYRLLLAVAAILVGYQGYLGGELGHTHGLSLPEGVHPPAHMQQILEEDHHLGDEGP
ncbi:MAG: hypothetical protein A2W61_07885 [Deltaproteobacteria bacterium RIFCSPLOWO2_01_44_7]|nr:MAG: hypothetical protein A2712_01415 [Deltaproteobacteria bacterium RIFCSPHIGHO2_01_FULL_43_49]OGQ15207.1 MAG: hypothetical protein A3D22_04060 [Deltaproteobacteria bacterium RIFCSPHIGHO2_02_FULL_44_53]OGQ27170.1 MAG: hypothetical protein A3D98_02005 [Deltaproteobacteria bacterium RIFCSPHIGHO2_12_FULL_44_21]OGQ31724.1 MAG: hypothetical protein A2979_05220 [Deltaproteobacteria bacterium RIFCSPLOWO2_01_FULL_45_74]OGQ41666.1 MAG: hypothetical protein A2W61_07885 [Deltaproteobacteria bacterium 